MRRRRRVRRGGHVGQGGAVLHAPSLGGTNTLRGDHDYRFHDRDMLLASAESRWPLLRDVDIAAFFDAGGVAARLGDLNLRRTSWGGGLRLHAGAPTLIRSDVGRSVEGYRKSIRVFRFSVVIAFLHPRASLRDCRNASIRGFRWDRQVESDLGFETSVA